MTHAPLIARLQTLSEPSREVDCQIAMALSFWPKYGPNKDEYAYVGGSKEEPAVKICRLGERPSLGDRSIWYTHSVYGKAHCLPAFTADLNATIALAKRVLPGWVIALEIGPVNYAVIEPPGTDYVGDHLQWDTVESGATPSIALCIAILKALDAQEERS